MHKIYDMPPHQLKRFEVDCREMMAFQYLPIKLAGQTKITMEERVSPFSELVGASCCDFVAEYGLDCFVESYVYLTAKHLFQGPAGTFNRPGWHCDGFLTSDVNYVWSSCSPTIYSKSRFMLTLDDEISMREMQQQSRPEDEYSLDPKILCRIDELVVHRVREPEQSELRTFFKLSISLDKYDLEGNSKNYLLDYDWPMRKRQLSRNTPQDLTHG